MEYEDIILDKRDGIAIITLNRPEKMNALSPGMMDCLPLAIEDVRQDDEVRVVVLTGAGRGFCTGADVGSMRARASSGEVTPSDRRDNLRATVHRIALALRGLDKPTIAM